MQRRTWEPRSFSPDPRKRFRGSVLDMDAATRATPEEGQTLRVRVAIETAEVPLVQPGTGVHAKIRCGTSSLGYACIYAALLH